MRGDDVEDGGVARVGRGEPESDWEVVGCIAERDGEEAVQAEEELSAPVVVSWAVVEETSDHREARTRGSLLYTSDLTRREGDASRAARTCVYTVSG